MDNTNNAFLNEDTMLERGIFEANGYKFHVRPVYLGEEDEYLSQMTVLPTPVPKEDGKEYTEKELGQWAIALFSKNVNSGSSNNDENLGFFKKIAKFFSKLFNRKNYEYYSEYPSIQPIVKWLEKKVTYKGKKIRFYDLERKFGLNKAEIEHLIIYFHELSGF